jgi:hypothetical protein
MECGEMKLTEMDKVFLIGTIGVILLCLVSLLFWNIHINKERTICLNDSTHYIETFANNKSNCCYIEVLGGWSIQEYYEKESCVLLKDYGVKKND